MTHSHDFPPKPQERPARPEKSPCTARPSEMPVCSQTQIETHVDLEMMARAKQYLKASVQPVQEKGPHAALMVFLVFRAGTEVGLGFGCFLGVLQSS
jgi:hypothetical protein